MPRGADLRRCRSCFVQLPHFLLVFCVFVVALVEEDWWLLPLPIVGSLLLTEM